MEAWYNLATEQVLKKLDTSFPGLNIQNIPELQKRFGKNVLQEAKRRSRLSILASQFADIMIIILIIAAIISFAVGEHTDAFVILAIIAGNAWMGYSQEYNAEEAVRLLQQMSSQHVYVVRDNNTLKIDSSELVPGDIILLTAGDIVPADARLIEVNALKTDESSLTGESFTVDKTTEPIAESNLVPGDQKNMIFKGTIVNNGSGTAVVTTTGMNTEIGKIAGMMETGIQKTPLQKRLAVFSKQLAIIVIIICLLVFAFGWWRGEPPFQMFLTALSLAVAALPEALPAVITIALAQGARRMVKQHALMRKLPAVETLGSVTYICSDKTGTLTQNIMTVEKVYADNEKLLMDAMMLNNEVIFTGRDELLGDSTETALVKYAQRKAITKQDADNRVPLLKKIPFDSVRMRMSTFHKHQGKWILFSKGAPVKIAEVISDDEKEQIPALLDKNREWAKDGLRVLFFAYRIFEELPVNLNEELEQQLHFLGMVAMIDPPRPEVIEAIRECKTAGIKTVMITGDQPLTASAIAIRLGMLDENTEDARTGAELNKLNEDQFNEITRRTRVYARVSPEQKLKIVKSLQGNGEFVSMTGDGVNDAPSLKQADIGIAMGITGTDVSKESADMILLDDNFATIVKAVREGRRIYENIKKFIVYVLSCNLSEILTIFFAPLLGFAIPLLPIHILWINLVTDGLPGIALVAEPAEKNIMNLPPRPPKENLFAGGLVSRILLSGLIMTIASLSVQWWAVYNGLDIRTQQTMVFTTLCFVQLGNALSTRSNYRSIFSDHLFSNRSMWMAITGTIVLQLIIIYVPFMRSVFKTNFLEWTSMSIILLVTCLTVLCLEFTKYLSRVKK